MALNAKDKTKLQKTYADMKMTLLQGTLVSLGAGRPASAQEGNYKEICGDLVRFAMKNTELEVKEAAAIMASVVGRPVEVLKPSDDNGAAAKLAVLEGASSNVRHVIAGVDVRLDNDQLKHQDLSVPIGTRTKGGGNRFVATCDATWHQTITMAHMAAWANQQAGMVEGQQKFHGQLVPVQDVHYEGYVLLSGGAKYVLFHCYPSNTSALLGKKA